MSKERMVTVRTNFNVKPIRWELHECDYNGDNPILIREFSHTEEGHLAAQACAALYALSRKMEMDAETKKWHQKMMDDTVREVSVWSDFMCRDLANCVVEDVPGGGFMNIIRRFPDTDEGLKEANDFAREHEAAIIAKTTPRMIVAKEDDSENPTCWVLIDCELDGSDPFKMYELPLKGENAVAAKAIAALCARHRERSLHESAFYWEKDFQIKTSRIVDVGHDNKCLRPNWYVCERFEGGGGSVVVERLGDGDQGMRDAWQAAAKHANKTGIALDFVVKMQVRYPNYPDLEPDMDKVGIAQS